MTEPVRTRADVERAVYAAVIGQINKAGLRHFMPYLPRDGGQHVGPITRHPEDLAQPIAAVTSAALLAIAECRFCLGKGECGCGCGFVCGSCHGTGLDALEGQ